MQITIADIDQLNPPEDAADLMRQAEAKGHTLWASWDSSQSGRRLFGLRIGGPGWDIVATWTVPQESAPDLSSLPLWQDAVGEWENANLAEVRERIDSRK